MVSALSRKAIRDAWHFRGQLLAVAAVVTCGTTSMVTMRGAMSESLSASQEAFYASERFADVFAHARRAPEHVVASIGAIPGVDRVESRIVTDVLLDVPGLTEPATGHLVSLPDRQPPLLNDVYLRSGRRFSPGAAGEVIASEVFAEANHLHAGDRIGALINGRWQDLTIVGIAMSPEFVYEVPPGGIFPDKRRYGVLWLSREQLAPALSMEGAFNDLTLRLERGASEAEVIAGVDALLERYGGFGAYGRRDQLSHRFLSDEIHQHAVMGVVIGYLFLGVAAFLLNVILGRVVATERDQIAVLKAFGYGNLRVAAHYLGFALVPVALGAAAGCGLGVWLGGLVAEVFGQFYRFPHLIRVVSPSVFVVATSVSLLAGALGTLAALARVFRLPPAEAMRPEAPVAARRSILDRLHLLGAVGPATRMIARNLARRPLRATMTMLGMALAVSLMVVGRYFFDAIEYMADLQFQRIERQDAVVTFTEARSARALYELARLPGVLAAEPFRTVPARLWHGHYRYRIGLQGLPPGGNLRVLLDRRNRRLPLPVRGVLLTTELARILHAAPGDTITVEVLEGRRPVRAVVLAGTIDELIGVGAYLPLEELFGLLEEGPTYSGARLEVDAGAADRLYSSLKRVPAVATVTVRQAVIDSFNQTLAGSMRISTRVMLVFACVIAVAVVYNGARITLSERGRELASLRVLGYTKGEVAVVLFGELGLLTLLSLPLGWALGIGICALMPVAFNTELYRLPLVITVKTQLFAAAVVLLSAAATGVVVRRRLNHLNLVAVLKTRE